MSLLQEKIKSIFGNKCPRCHKGDFFKSGNPWNLRSFDKMHHYCPSCGENFEREVGFYYGAMYINYAFTVILGLIWFLFYYFIFGFDALPFLISYSIILLILFPWIFRTGRLIWINLFVRKKS